MLSQFQQAIEDFDQAINLAPEHDKVYFNWSLAYSTLGKKAEAIADFKKVITLSDNPQIIEMVSQHIEELSK